MTIPDLAGGESADKASPRMMKKTERRMEWIYILTMWGKLRLETRIGEADEEDEDHGWGQACFLSHF